MIKYLLILLCSLGLITSCQSDDNVTISCLPETMQDNVLALYAFTDGSLLDFSGNNNDLVNTSRAKPSIDREGNINCCYLFDNTQPDKEVLISINPVFLNGLNKFSISLWFVPMDSSRAPGLYEVLLSRGEERRCPDRRGEWSVGLYDGRLPVLGHNNSVWANEIPQVNEWYHLVVVKDDDNLSIHLNGKIRGQTTGVANCTNLHLAEDLGDLFIGSTFIGKLDDIIIFDKALTDEEIITLSEISSCCQ